MHGMLYFQNLICSFKNQKQNLMALVLAIALAKKEYRNKVVALAKQMISQPMVYEHEDDALQEKEYLQNIMSFAPRQNFVLPETPNEEWVRSLIRSFNWRKCTQPDEKMLLDSWNESRAKHFLRMSIASGKPVYFRAMRVEHPGVFKDMLAKESLKKNPSAVALDSLSFLHAMQKGFRRIVHVPSTAVTSVDALVIGNTPILKDSVMICRKPNPIGKRVIDGFAKDVALSPSIIAARSVYHLVMSN